MKYRLVKQDGNKYVLVGNGVELDISEILAESETQEKELQKGKSILETLEPEKNNYDYFDLIEDLVDTVVEMNATSQQMVKELISVLMKYVD